MTKKFLLTGGSGVLGTELQSCAEQYDIEYLAPSRGKFDITDNNSDYKMSFDNKRFCELGLVGIVHAAAYTDVPGAETDKGRVCAIRTNIFGTQNVVELANMLGVPVVYISTDYVYEGVCGNYREDDFVRPVNYYAMTKLMGEAFLDKNYDLVIRTSFKPKVPWPYPKAFDDLYTSSDYVDVIAPKINFLVFEQVSGIYNVGTERKTIYKLAKGRNGFVEPMSRVEVKSVHLPLDISMNLDKCHDLMKEERKDEG